MENPDNVAADRPLRRSELAVKLTKAGFPHCNADACAVSRRRLRATLPHLGPVSDL
jgi:hypothetical protein